MWTRWTFILANIINRLECLSRLIVWGAWLVLNTYKSMTRELKSNASKLCKHLECHNMIGVVLIAMTVTCTLRIFLSLLKFPIHGCSLPTWTLSKACFHKVGSWKKAENREEKGNEITIVKKWGSTPHARGKDEDRANRIKRKKAVDDGARGKRRWFLPVFVRQCLLYFQL